MGGIIVAQPPHFLFLKSSRGDDHADIRQEILGGWGIADTHGQAGNLHYGYDNWLYGSVGYDGFDGMVAARPVKFTMGTYRFKADGSALEFLHQFTNNTWAHSANDAGTNSAAPPMGALVLRRNSAQCGSKRNACDDGEKNHVVDNVHAITPNYRRWMYSTVTPPRQDPTSFTRPIFRRACKARRWYVNHHESDHPHGRAAGRRRLQGEGWDESCGEYR